MGIHIFPLSWNLSLILWLPAAVSGCIYLTLYTRTVYVKLREPEIHRVGLTANRLSAGLDTMSEGGGGGGGCMKANKNARKGLGNVRWQHPEIPLTIMEENSLSSSHKESSSLTFHNIFNEIDGPPALSLEIIQLGFQQI